MTPDENVQWRLSGTMLLHVDWTSNSLYEVIKYLRNAAGASIVVMKDVEEAQLTERPILPELVLNGISAHDALQVAVQSFGLAFRIEDGVVIITASDDPHHGPR